MIRPATPDDAEAIFELVRLLAEYEREPDAVLTSAETLRADLSAPDPPFECLLAEEDGRAVGIALFHETYSTWTGRALYLEDFFVREDARGGGVGKALFLRVAQLAVERGYRRGDLSLLNWNTPAIDLYAPPGGPAGGDRTPVPVAGDAR